MISRAELKRLTPWGHEGEQVPKTDDSSVGHFKATRGAGLWGDKFRVRIAPVMQQIARHDPTRAAAYLQRVEAVDNIALITFWSLYRGPKRINGTLSKSLCA